MTEQRTGYPHIDRPWMKYYDEKARNSEAPEKTLYRYIYDINKNHKEYKALHYLGRDWDYGEFFSDIEATAKAFQALGIGKGDVVILCFVNMPEAFHAIYALNMIGAIGNLVDPRSGLTNMKHYITQVDAKVIVTIDVAYPLMVEAAEETTVEKIVVAPIARSMAPAVRFVYNLKNRKKDHSWKKAENTLGWDRFLALGEGQEVKEVPFEKGRCTLMEHTGGTTGRPKTVMLTDEGINTVVMCHTFTGVPTVAGKDTYYTDMPPFILYGFAITFHMGAGYGMQMILNPQFDPQGFPEHLKKYKPNHVCAIPEHFKNMADSEALDGVDLSFLKTVCAGGDKVSPDVEEHINNFLKEHGCRYTMIQGYGMTELSPTACTTTQAINGPGSVGIPLVKVNLRIVDQDTHENLKIGESGEVYISSPGLMLGYLGDQAATDELITTDENGERWLKTGDLGHITEDGMLVHEGRLRRIYITADNGNPAKIFPFVPEQAIKDSGKVADCAVVGRVKEGTTYYEPVAFIVRHGDEDEKTLTEELKEVCRENVAPYMCPVEYVFIDKIPLTKIAKVDFKTLEKQAASLKETTA